MGFHKSEGDPGFSLYSLTDFFSNLLSLTAVATE